MSGDQDVEARLGRFAARARGRLSEHFERWRGEMPAGNRPVTPSLLFDLVADLTLRGGKRLRPALAFYTAGCFDHGLQEEMLLDAALSLEVLQTALLIHDDIMDRDRYRRGGPSVHSELERLTGDPHLGQSLGILAGSLAYALAQRLLLQAGLPDGRFRPASHVLVRMQSEVVYGQVYDLVGGVGPAVIHRYKTTSYTTLGAVHLGAAVAGAPLDAYPVLEAYAIPLGRAFQMADDLLNLFGERARLGKPIGSDLVEGKRTDLVEIAMADADEPGREMIRHVLGRRDATPAEVGAACRAIEASGARSQVEARILACTEEAIDALEGATFLPEGLSFLRQVARWLVGRDR